MFATDPTRPSLFLLGLVVACGGEAVVDEGASGGGGSGGAVTSSSSSSGTASSSSSGTTSSSSSSGTASSSSSSGGDPICDEVGDCQDCFACAIDPYCQAQYEGCIYSPQCQEFQGCLGPCIDEPDCLDTCTQQYPQGAQLYVELMDCVVCGFCIVSCSDLGFCVD